MEYNSTPKPAYWAVLPAAVRYDQELPPNAKLLYAELSALANIYGFCFASNSYFAKLFAVDARTIQRLLSQLQDRNYIVAQVERNAATNAVIGRKIYVGINPLFQSEVSAAGALPHDKIVVTPPDKNVMTPHDNFVTPNKDNNININNIPPIVPQGTRKRQKHTSWKPERFDRFWKFYPRKDNKESARKAWDKLQPSDELLAEIGHKLIILKASPGWSDKKYIPQASTFLNGKRWNDVENLADASSGQASATGQSSGWAEDPEVM